MKIVAYVSFVIAVLLLSAFARASEVQYERLVQVDQLAPDLTQKQLKVQGTLPNPCYNAPSVSLTPDANDSRVLILRLASPLPMGICPSVVKPFTSVIDLPTLAFASQVPVDQKAVYLIKAEGSEFSIEVPGSSLVL